MKTLVVMALIVTAASLLVGIKSMSQGGDEDRQQSAKLMMSRVGLQAVAFFLLLTALFVGGN